MTMTVEQFWQMADYERLQTEYLVNRQVQHIGEASIAALRRLFLQYRYFTEYYGSDLGLLIYRAPYGRFKSLITDIANEELGNGEATQSHLHLWDDFLVSLGVPRSQFFHAIDPHNKELLEELRHHMLTAPYPYTVGLRGMGGECLCQVYLTAVYNHLIRNPVIQQRSSQLEWTFWQIHTGAVDIEHRRLVREAINDIVTTESTTIEALAQGYRRAKEIWEQFWGNAYALMDQAEGVASASNA